MCGYYNVAYVSLLNDEVSSERNKQNQPGRLSYFGVIIFKLLIWLAPPCMFLASTPTRSMNTQEGKNLANIYPAILTSLVSDPDILLKATPQMIPQDYSKHFFFFKLRRLTVKFTVPLRLLNKYIFNNSVHKPRCGSWIHQKKWWIQLPYLGLNEDIKVWITPPRGLHKTRNVTYRFCF